MKVYKIVFVLMVSLVCVSFSLAATIGNKPDAVAPKLQIGADNVKVWDRPDAFGPVPAKLRSFGKKICGADKKAIGFHPKAQDENGKVFPRGGFFCVPIK